MVMNMGGLALAAAASSVPMMANASDPLACLGATLSIGQIISDVSSGNLDGESIPQDLSTFITLIQCSSAEDVTALAATLGLDESLVAPAVEFITALTEEQTTALVDGIDTVLNEGTLPLNDILEVYGYDALPAFDFDAFRENVYNAIESVDVQQQVDELLEQTPIDEILNGADFNAVFDENGNFDFTLFQEALDLLDLSVIPRDLLQSIVNDIDFAALWDSYPVSDFLPAADLVTSITFVRGLYYVTALKAQATVLPQLNFLVDDDPFSFWSCFDASFTIDAEDLTAISQGGAGTDCTDFNTACGPVWTGAYDQYIVKQTIGTDTMSCPALPECVEAFSYPCFVEAATISAPNVEVGVQKGVADTLTCVSITAENSNAIQLNIILQAAVANLFGEAYEVAAALNFGTVPELMYSANMFTEVEANCYINNSGTYVKNIAQLNIALRSMFGDTEASSNSGDSSNSGSGGSKNNGFDVGAAAGMAPSMMAGVAVASLVSYYM